LSPGLCLNMNEPRIAPHCPRVETQGFMPAWRRHAPHMGDARIPRVETQGFMPAWRRHAPPPILVVFNREAVKDWSPAFQRGVHVATTLPAPTGRWIGAPRFNAGYMWQPHCPPRRGGGLETRVSTRGTCGNHIARPDGAVDWSPGFQSGVHDASPHIRPDGAGEFRITHTP